MTLLEAINTVLRSVGEARVSSIASGHPQMDTVQDFINEANSVLQSRGWWFNTFTREYAPDGDAKIPVPEDVKFWKPTRLCLDYVALGGFVADAKTGETLTGQTSSIEAKVRLELPCDVAGFPYLPDTFGKHLAAVAALEYAADYDADQLQLQKLSARVVSTKRMLEADNIRYAKLNVYETGSVGSALARNYGNRYYPYL